MSVFSQASGYLAYWFRSVNRHSVHSPFIYTLVDSVINAKKHHADFDDIEQRRKELENNKELIEVIDFGAGTSGKKIIGAIAASSSKSKKYASLLYRITKNYQPAYMIELGSAFGISGAYQARGNSSGKLYTLEGNAASAEIARDTFRKCNITNAEVFTGPFNETLPVLLAKLPRIDYAFIDGNHREMPTLEYFELLLNKSHQETIFIFDDINWSNEMKQAWSKIKQHQRVRVTVDLYMMGIVFINPDLTKQDYLIRY